MVVLIKRNLLKNVHIKFQLLSVMQKKYPLITICLSFTYNVPLEKL